MAAPRPRRQARLIDQYPGVADGLRALIRSYPLFIVGNCQAGYVETFLCRETDSAVDTFAELTALLRCP